MNDTKIEQWIKDAAHEIDQNYDTRDTDKESEAHIAAMIAKYAPAPELLAALRNLLKFTKGFSGRKIDVLNKQAEAAISKASICLGCKRPKANHIPDCGKLACPVQSMGERVPIAYFVSEGDPQ